MPAPVKVGAVLYAPKVSVIWDIIRRYFEENNCPMDVVLYRDYALQSKALVAGDIDIAWNSPLAWLDCQRLSGGACRAIAMRDSDRDRASHIVVKKSSDIRRLQDLRGKTLAVGAKDSPQATLIPIGFLQRNGLAPGKDFKVLRFDLLVGLHGDHLGGEGEAMKALKRGDADASAMIDLNWQRWTRDGTLSPDEYATLAVTDRYDHCVFGGREGLPAEAEQRWLKVLFSMSYDNPAHREMMDMEGLKKWLPGRTSGFAPLDDAVKAQRFFELNLV